MGGKTFALIRLGAYQLNASVALFVVPLIFTINDIITEVYGAERTRSIVRSGLVTIVLIIVFSLLATNLPPSNRFKATEKAYDAIFGLSARIAASSLTAFALAEFVDIFVFARIRKRLGKKALWLRNNISNFISQFFDTTIFMTLAFYSSDKPFLQNFNFLLSLITPYYGLKCLMSVFETPLVYLGVQWLKQNDGE